MNNSFVSKMLKLTMTKMDSLTGYGYVGAW